MGKTVVIGLDGVDWSVLSDAIADGVTPNIATVYNNGVHGDLQSIDPPISIPAWLCFSTGKQPDKLDIYNFVIREPGTYNLHYIHNSPTYQKQCFWTVFDEETEIGVVNVPSIFPVGEYNGVFVSGPLAASGVYPEQVRKTMAEYGFDSSIPKGWNFSDSMEQLEKNGDFLAHVLSEDPDFFLGVINTTDRVQHAYWDNPEKMQELYAATDKQVGKLLEHVDLETDNVFILSDHGFAAIKKAFYLNTWLKEHGFLTVKQGYEDDVKQEERRLKLKKLAKTVLSKLGVLEQAIKYIPDRIQKQVNEPDEVWEKIDWEHTQAYASGQYVGQIYLNTVEDHPNGVVTPDEYDAVRQAIIDELQQLEDPETGEPVVEHIWTKEELYRDFAERAPDITFYTQDMQYKVKEEIYPNLFADSIPAGAHRKTGVLIAAGPDIAAGTIEEMNLIDVAPTVLHLMGCAVPREMDGTVRYELFETSSDAAERDVEWRAEEVAGIDF